jgi:hypothetical protein
MAARVAGYKPGMGNLPDLHLPPEALALLRTASRFETPCGAGTMVWHTWGQATRRPELAPLVLLHGGSGSWMHWLRNIPALAASGRWVLVPDLPGFGDSAAPPQAAPMPTCCPSLWSRAWPCWWAIRPATWWVFHLAAWWPASWPALSRAGCARGAGGRARPGRGAGKGDAPARLAAHHRCRRARRDPSPQPRGPDAVPRGGYHRTGLAPAHRQRAARPHEGPKPGAHRCAGAGTGRRALPGAGDLRAGGCAVPRQARCLQAALARAAGFQGPGLDRRCRPLGAV